MNVQQEFVFPSTEASMRRSDIWGNARSPRWLPVPGLGLELKPIFRQTWHFHHHTGKAVPLQARYLELPVVPVS